MDAVERAMSAIRRNVGHLLASPSLTPYPFRPMPGTAVGLEKTVTLDERVFDLRNRPIGMVRLATSPRVFSLQPQVFVLTYEVARDAAARDKGFGPGVVEVRYEEARELEGDYTLYFKVERVRQGRSVGEPYPRKECRRCRHET